MKKTILFLSVVFAVATTSCKKDYVCSCTVTSTDPTSTAFTYEDTYKEVRKSDAANKCVKLTQTAGGFTETQDCKLK
jgi:hypothetical protein